MEILKTKFDDITKFNEIVVLLCEKHVNIKEKGATINWNGDGEKIYLKLKSSDESKGPQLVMHTKAELLNWKNVFNAKMKEIKESAVINYCDYEILEKLSEMEKCDFFIELTNVIKLANFDIGIQSVNNNIKEFKRINEEFKKMCSISEYYQLLDVSEEDMLQINAIYKSLANNTFSIRSINREIMKARIEAQLKNQGVQLSEQDIEMLSDAVMSGTPIKK